MHPPNKKKEDIKYLNIKTAEISMRVWCKWLEGKKTYR